jgi:hypothetical protein
VKLIRVLLSRLALLLIVAAAFIGWRTTYVSLVLHFMLANAHWRVALQDSRPSAPDVAYFPDFVYRAGLLALFCIAGRLVFRLRLTSVPRGEGPVLLDLRREGQRSLTSSPTPSDASPPTP